MKGTLEEPPILFEQDRGKLCLLAVASLGFTLLFASFLWTGTGRSVLAGYCVTIGFGTGSLLMGYATLHPNRLVIGPDGVTFSTPFRTFRRSWDAYSNFVIYSPNPFSRQPGCVYSESYRAQRILPRLSGGIGAFGPCWKDAPQEIVDVLNKAREYWTKTKLPPDAVVQ